MMELIKTSIVPTGQSNTYRVYILCRDATGAFLETIIPDMTIDNLEIDHETSCNELEPTDCTVVLKAQRPDRGRDQKLLTQLKYTCENKK